MSNEKNTIQQGLGSKVKSWFKSKKTLWIAIFLLRIVKIAIKIYDYLTS
jgi:hypothetical protein